MTKKFKSKSVKSKDNGPTDVKFPTPDRIKFNMSLEIFDGCWVGGGYETDLGPGETLDECRERVADFVETMIAEKSDEIIKEREETND